MLNPLDIMKWLGFFNYRKINGFLNAEEGKGGVIEALLRVILSALIFLIIPSAILGFIEVSVGFSIIFFVFFLVSNILLHVIARIFGGRGNFSHMVHMNSYVAAAMNLAFLVFILASLPFIFQYQVPSLLENILRIFAISITLLFFTYCLYAIHLMAIRVYGLSDGKAMAAVILDIITTIVALIAASYWLFVWLMSDVELIRIGT